MDIERLAQWQKQVADEKANAALQATFGVTGDSNIADVFADGSGAETGATTPADRSLPKIIALIAGAVAGLGLLQYNAEQNQPRAGSAQMIRDDITRSYSDRITYYSNPVSAPDWNEKERMEYVRDLAKMLRQHVQNEP